MARTSSDAQGYVHTLLDVQLCTNRSKGWKVMYREAVVAFSTSMGICKRIPKALAIPKAWTGLPGNRGG